MDTSNQQRRRTVLCSRVHTLDQQPVGRFFRMPRISYFILIRLLTPYLLLLPPAPHWTPPKWNGRRFTRQNNCRSKEAVREEGSRPAINRTPPRTKQFQSFSSRTFFKLCWSNWRFDCGNDRLCSCWTHRGSPLKGFESPGWTRASHHCYGDEHGVALLVSQEKALLLQNPTKQKSPEKVFRRFGDELRETS